MVFFMDQQQSAANAAQAPLQRPSWRTASEIDADRQAFLRRQLSLPPDIQQSIYPFKDVKLTRADIEWLLVLHEQEHGPLDWNDTQQYERERIDLRGANLQHVNLCNLPLACIRGGLTQQEWVTTTLEQRAMAGVHLEHSDLSEAHLEGALLRGAFLQGATLRATHLEQAVLFQAHLERAHLRLAHLEGANMNSAHLEGTYFRKAWLMGTDLRHAVCDNNTNLEKVTLLDKKWGCALLADIHWGDCNLAVINWRSVMPLGDERLARALQECDRQARSYKEKQEHLEATQAAVRTYRQLANALRAQGMNEEAIPFAYRAQTLQRRVLWQEVFRGLGYASPAGIPPGNARQKVRHLWRRFRKFDAYIFSWFLDIIAGYGYKPGRSLVIYLLAIICFAVCYLAFGHLSPGEALVFSVTSFHGRGFFPGPFTIGAPVTAIAALEAVVGLVIEISFIATFTQRYFGR